MSVILTKPAAAPLMPVLDPAPAVLPDVPQLDDALDAGIDSIIADAARADAPRKVTGRVRGWQQSHTARAWTRGGSVD